MFDDLKCCIINKKQKLITGGTKKGRLYHFQCKTRACSERIYATLTENLWHRRYGHLSSKYLQLLAKKKLVTSFNYNSLKSIDFCETCVEGKQHRSQFPSSEWLAKEPLELVHSDICGKLEASSLSGGQHR